MHGITLADGTPLYSVLATDESPELARIRLRNLHKADPLAVQSCQGKTAIEALAILESIGAEEIYGVPMVTDFEMAA